MTKAAKYSIWALISLIFISLAIRPPVAAIGPLVEELIKTESLSLFQISLISSLPIVCFGIGAFASPALVKAFTLNRAVMVVLVILSLAMALRLFGGFPAIMIGTVLIGLTIAVANVLIPTIVREQFPDRIELITGVYVTLLAISASFAAGIAVPSSLALGGWRGALAVWILPAVLAIVFWLPLYRSKSKTQFTSVATHELERKAVLRSSLTWGIVFFFGLQSGGFYSILNWLPSLLIDRGYSASEAGALLGLTTFVGVPSGFAASLVFRRFKALSLIAVIMSSFILCGLMMIWLFPNFLVLACIVTGFGFAATFPLSLTLIGSRASTTTQTTQLSAIAQGYGYIIAAASTFTFGLLRDLTGSWNASLVLISVLTLMQLSAGFVAGRDKRIPAA